MSKQSGSRDDDDSDDDDDVAVKKTAVPKKDVPNRLSTKVDTSAGTNPRPSRNVAAGVEGRKTATLPGVDDRVDPASQSQSERKSQRGTILPRPSARPHPLAESENRSCTDLCCCVLFFLSILGYVVVAALAFRNGNIDIFLYPEDSQGNLCGFGEYTNRTKLFYFDLTRCAVYGMGVFVLGCPTPQVCVHECPKEWFLPVSSLNQPEVIRQKVICKDGVNKSSAAIDMLVSQQYCAPYYLKSTSFLQRCVPDQSAPELQKVLMVSRQKIDAALGDKVKTSDILAAIKMFRQYLGTREFLDKLVADIVNSRQVILGSLITVLGVSLLFVILMRFITVPLFYLCIGLYVCGFALAAGFFWRLCKQEKGSGKTFSGWPIVNWTVLREDVYLLAMVLCCCALVAIFVGLYNQREKINLALLIVDEGGRVLQSDTDGRGSEERKMQWAPFLLTGLMRFKTLGNMLSVCVWPLFTATLTLLVTVVGVVVILHLASIRRIKDKDLTNMFDRNYNTTQLTNVSATSFNSSVLNTSAFQAGRGRRTTRWVERGSFRRVTAKVRRVTNESDNILTLSQPWALSGSHPSFKNHVSENLSVVQGLHSSSPTAHADRMRRGLPNAQSDVDKTLDDTVRSKLDQYFQQLPCEDMGDGYGETLRVSQACGVLKYSDANDMRTYSSYLLAFSFIMLLWLVGFLVSFGQVTVAGVFTSYYWAWDKVWDTKMVPLASSVYQTTRYHLGSLAFGAVLRVNARFIRLALFVLRQFGVRFPVSSHIRFAFIMISMKGKSFWSSAREVKLLIQTSPVDIKSVGRVASLVFFVSKIILTGAATTGAYFAFAGELVFLRPYIPEVNFIAAPVTLIGVASYTITAAVFSVYRIASDTLLICLLTDLKLNDGSAEKPYYMRKSLRGELGVGMKDHAEK